LNFRIRNGGHRPPLQRLLLQRRSLSAEVRFHCKAATALGREFFRFVIFVPSAGKMPIGPQVKPDRH